MTLIQLNDLLMVVIGTGVTTLSIMAYRYYKRAPLFDSSDVENDITHDFAHQGKRLAKRDLKRTKKARLAERA